ncbi:MAG: RpiB/LacA/LacB family sugar-phosphate isomerase [Candidatus Andersenbacteria bacterium]
MQIYIGADHRGLALKESLKNWLQEAGHEVTDVGPTTVNKDDDYPDYGIQVARAVGEAPKERRGIVICGSGVGMAVVADKVKGVRAGLIHDPRIAEAARRDDNINVLALGADFVDEEQAREVVSAWLTTDFSGKDRHQRRLDKIQRYEHEHSCPCA